MSQLPAPPVAEHLAGLPILRHARTGSLADGWVRRWLVAELQCQDAEIAAFAAMGARFVGNDQAVALVSDVVKALLSGREAWDAAAAAVGAVRADQVAHPVAGAFQFAGLVSWLAFHGTPAEVALVVHDDWLLYCAACASLAAELGSSGAVPPPVADYLAAYGTAPQWIIDAAADLVAASLADPDQAPLVHRSQPLVAPALTAFWRGVAGE